MNGAPGASNQYPGAEAPLQIGACGTAEAVPLSKTAEQCLRSRALRAILFQMESPGDSSKTQIPFGNDKQRELHLRGNRYKAPLLRISKRTFSAHRLTKWTAKRTGEGLRDRGLESFGVEP